LTLGRWAGEFLAGMNFFQRTAPFILATLLGFASAAHAATSADATLRVMSFNVRNSNSKDGENAWPLRRDLFFAEITRFAPALIGFQEVLADQHDAIVERMGDYAFVGVARDDGKRKGEWSLIGFRKDRFENLGGGDFWLSETPEVAGSKSWDAALTRICTWVRLRDRVTKREFLYANTHFDHKGVQAREQAAHVIAKRVRDLAHGEPIILTGDLNINEDTRAYAVLAKPQGDAPAWLIDSYRETHPHRAPDEASFHAFKGTVTGSRIDFIFHSREFKATASTIERNASPTGKFPSDHYAVTAFLELAAANATATQ
jgi:endonuclease/exonuclease/phosphatase family metal-dependent hydrolase